MLRRRQGFTLVEMLVVIAIIIILAAILFPAFIRAREKAQQTRCVNQMKQWGAAVELYEDDYEGAVCPVSVGSGQPGQETGATASIFYGYMWADLLNPYTRALKKGSEAGRATGQGELMNCPSAPMEQMTSGNAWQGYKTYGYNPYLTRTTTTTDARYPSLTLRLTETANYQMGHPLDPAMEGKDPGYVGGSWYAPLPDGFAKGYRFKLYAPGWHNGMNTVLWVDGHVSTLDWQKVMQTDNCRGTTTDVNTWCRLQPKDGTTPES